MSDFKSQRSDSANTMEVRIAYPFLHERRTKRANGAPIKTPRNDAVLIVPKLNADPAQCANYRFFSDLALAAATKSWGQFPAGGHWPIQDGDAPMKPKAPTVPGQAVTAPKEYPWRKGNWIIEVTHYLEPGPRVCVMQNGTQTEIPAKTINGRQMYKSGDFGIVHVHSYSFQNEKFGVNFGFEGVLFTREGDAIGSSGPKSATAMFGQVQQMAPPTGPAPMPGQAPMPPQPVQRQPVYASPPVAPVAQGYAQPGPPAGAPMPPQPTGNYAAPGMAPLPPLPGQR